MGQASTDAEGKTEAEEDAVDVPATASAASATAASATAAAASAAFRLWFEPSILSKTALIRFRCITGVQLTRLRFITGVQLIPSVNTFTWFSRTLSERCSSYTATSEEESDELETPGFDLMPGEPDARGARR